jgi:hypothetical protein
MSESISDLQQMTPEVAKELTSEEKDVQLTEMSARSFFAGDRALRKTTLSRGAIIRALRAALHEDLTDTQLKLISQEEKNLAVMLYEMLTARTLMQALIIKNNNKQGVNNEQSNESSVPSES